MRRGILGMVRRRQQRPPAGLLRRSRVPVAVARHGTERVTRDRGRIEAAVDRRDRAPEQVVVLRVHHRDLRVRADDVDHRRQSCGSHQVEPACVCDVTGEAVVLTDHVRRPEPRDVRLVSRAHAAVCRAVALDLVEPLNPIAALQRRRRVRQDLVGAAQDERPHVGDPRGLRQREGRCQTPYPWSLRDRRKGRAHADRRHASVTVPQVDDLVCGRQADRLPVVLRGPVGNQPERLGVLRAQRRGLSREVVHERPIRRLHDRRVGRRAGCSRDGCVVRRVVALDRDNGVVHRSRFVGHVDQALVLERTRTDHRVLCDLVPLLDRVPRRQGRGRVLRGPGYSRKGDGCDCNHHGTHVPPHDIHLSLLPERFSPLPPRLRAGGHAAYPASTVIEGVLACAFERGQPA